MIWRKPYRQVRSCISMRFGWACRGKLQWLRKFLYRGLAIKIEMQKESPF